MMLMMMMMKIAQLWPSFAKFSLFQSILAKFCQVLPHLAKLSWPKSRTFEELLFLFRNNEATNSGIFWVNKKSLAGVQENRGWGKQGLGDFANVQIWAFFPRYWLHQGGGQINYDDDDYDIEDDDDDDDDDTISIQSYCDRT